MVYAVYLLTLGSRGKQLSICSQNFTGSNSEVVWRSPNQNDFIPKATLKQLTSNVSDTCCSKPTMIKHLAFRKWNCGFGEVKNAEYCVSMIVSFAVAWSRHDKNATSLDSAATVLTE
eukprot:1593733-Amphidinium_carterae.1